MGKLKCLPAVVAVALLSAGAVHAEVVTYTFNNLNTGTLAGQDNWTHDAGYQMAVFQDGLPGNGTKVAGGPYFQTNASNFSYRENDGNFSVPALSETMTNVYFQYDVRANRETYDQSIFYLSGGGGASPQIGCEPTNFTVRKANGGSSFFGAIPDRVTADHWVRLRLVMDFTANNGDGYGSLYYEDLTLGDTSFTLVPGMENLALGLNTGGVDPTAWNRLHIRTGFLADSVMDNLTVSVPEPATLALLAAGGLGLALRRRRG